MTGYMVKESRKLEIENGASIQPLQTISGRSINNKTIEITQQYYQNDQVPKFYLVRKTLCL